MPVGKRVFVSLALVFALTIVISIFGPALVFGVSFYTTQVTDNQYTDRDPQISGGNVVWRGFDGNDWEIYFWDGEEVTQVTDNQSDDVSPQISGGNVVWQGHDGQDREIYFWDGEEVTQVTDNQWNDGYAQISGSNVVWSGYDGNFYEIYFWNGEEVTQLTDNQYVDWGPQISGGNVVWQGSDGQDNEIFFWDGLEITQVTDNQYDDGGPQISGGNVVWSGFDGQNGQIYFWNGEEVTQLTDNQYDDGGPQISGGNVVWLGEVGGIYSDWEIFFWDGEEVTQVTDNQWNDVGPEIDGGNVVWFGGQDSEIYFWDGDEVTQVTDNQYVGDPQIDGGNVVWWGYDGHDGEIFLETVASVYTPVSESPVSVEPAPGVIVTFQEVTEAGNTEVTISTTPPPGPPIGFRFRGNEFNITTDAIYTPPVLVTIPYDDTGMNEQAEGDLKLFHHDGDSWVDVTVSVDTVNNTITGQVDSLSPFIVGEEEVPASINIDSETLNMQSKGAYITAYLGLPQGYDVTTIDSSTVVLHGITADVGIDKFAPTELVDEDKNGTPDYLMVKFDRYAVQGVVGVPDDVELGITFTLLDGTSCGGTDTIKVIDKGKAHFDSRDPASVEY